MGGNVFSRFSVAVSNKEGKEIFHGPLSAPMFRNGRKKVIIDYYVRDNVRKLRFLRALGTVAASLKTMEWLPRSRPPLDK